MKGRILIIVGVIVITCCWAALAESSSEQAFEKAKELYEKGDYQQSVEVLEKYFTDDNIYALGMDYIDPIVVKGCNLLGDCYRLTGRYDLAFQTFAMILENIGEGQSKYNYALASFLIPYVQRDGYIISNPGGVSLSGPSQYNIFHTLIAALDSHDRGVHIDMKAIANNILGWMNTEKRGWLRVLLLWYSGTDVDLNELAEELSDDAKARLYFYAGLKCEIEDDWKEAKVWYNKSVGQKGAKIFEVDIAKLRLGKFDIDPDGHFYAESSSTLVEKASGNLVKHRVLNLFDNNLATAWVPDNPAPLEEWFSINLYEKEYVEQVKIINGYAKSEVLFRKNCRAKVLRLLFSDGSEQRLVLKDSMEPQYFLIDREVKAIKVFVNEIIKGDQYQDLCVSEFQLDFKQ